MRKNGANFCGAEIKLYAYVDVRKSDEPI